jgi:hypothetical protein
MTPMRESPSFLVRRIGGGGDDGRRAEYGTLSLRAVFGSLYEFHFVTYVSMID